MYVWDPLLLTRGTGAAARDGLVAAVATLRHHKAKILSLVLAPGLDPLRPKPRLVTVSADNRVAVWDISCEKQWGNVQLLTKLKPKDITITGACAVLAHDYHAATANVLLSTSGATVHGLSLSDSGTHIAADLTPNLPPRSSEKKGAKLYAIAAAVLHPHVAAVASNAGIGLMHSAAVPSTAVCGLPAAQTFADRKDLVRVDSGGDATSASAVFLSGHKLVGATFVADAAAADDAAAAAAADVGSVAMPLPVTRSGMCASVPHPLLCPAS